MECSDNGHSFQVLDDSSAERDTSLDEFVYVDSDVITWSLMEHNDILECINKNENASLENSESESSDEEDLPVPSKKMHWNLWKLYVAFCVRKRELNIL